MTGPHGSNIERLATGAFEVKLNPLPVYDGADGSPLGHLSIDKQFHGELDATSKGEMLSAGTSVKGSAGYVAIERVTGTLHGRRGSFVLQHSGTMTRGAAQLTVSVVPTPVPSSSSGSPARWRSSSPPTVSTHMSSRTA